MTPDEAFERIMEMIREECTDEDAEATLALVGGYCISAVYRARQAWNASMS